MHLALRIRHFHIVVALAIALAQPIQAAGRKGASFGIFEVVECATAGSKAMQLKQGDSIEKYCLSAKPIVDQTYLSEAKRTTNDFGEQMLELTLTKQGGELMAKTTQRMVEQHSRKGGRGKLGLVVDGKLISAATLMDAINERLSLHGGWTREELDGIVSYLNGGPTQAPSGLRKS
jgi:hypothetical protein